MEQKEIQGVRAALVSVLTKNESEREAEVSLAELERLLETAGLMVMP